MGFRFRVLSGLRRMPISRAFLLFFLLLGAHGPGQAQDSAADGPARPAAHDAPPPSEEGAPAEPSVPPQGEPLAPPADGLGLYSPDVLVDLPYVYPLLRMRLTPEMRRGAP